MKRSRKKKTSWSGSWRFPSDPLAWLIEILLLALLTFAPFAFGAVEPWSELIAIALATMLASCVAMWLLLCSDLPLVRTWAFAPLVLFLLLAAAQIIPLPAKIISLISPNTAATRVGLLSDLPDSVQKLQAYTLSFYPHATRHDLRLVIAASSVFFAIVNYYRKPETIKRLLAGIAIIGSAVGLLAFAQDAGGSANIFFIGPPGRGKATAGPFVHYSHFSQFMNLCVGAMLGLLLVFLYRKFRRSGFKVRDLPQRWQDLTLRPMWLLAAAICLGVTTIFMSGSRGGMIATFIAFGLVTFSMSTIKNLPGQGWLIVPLVLMVFGVASFFGFDVAMNRLDTLRHPDQTGGRLQMLKDLTVEWRQFPLLGTGLGTHEVVYPRYDRSMELARATHAEDEYAQVIEEMGFVGFAIVLWFVAVVWINFAKALRNGDTSSQLVATGLGFGLIAVCAHSFTDFGQHTLAVSCLTATVCGLIISVARVPRPVEAQVTEPRSNLPVVETNPKPEMIEKKPSLPPLTWSLGRLGIGCAALIITAAGAWAVLGAKTSFAAESEWQLADAQEKSFKNDESQPTPAELANLITHATAAVKRDPDNAEHRCFLNVYRWQAAVGTTNGKGVITSQLRTNSRLILSDLNTARFDCPVYGPDYYLAAQIEDKVFHDPIAERHARAAYELSQTDPGACFFVGSFDVRAGRWNDSKAKFVRFMAMSGSFQSVIDSYVGEAGRPDLAVELAGNDIGRLRMLAATLARDTQYAQLAKQIDSQAFDLLRRQCVEEDAPAELLADYAEELLKRKDMGNAIVAYRRAIDLDYGKVEWHLALANALAQTAQVPAAMHEAQICLRLSPEMPEAQKILGDLSLLPAGHDQ